MSAETMKIPDPIMTPTTTITESNKPRPRANVVGEELAAEVDLVRDDLTVVQLPCGRGIRLAVEKKRSQQKENLYTISNELAISIPLQVRLGVRIVMTRGYFIQKDLRCRVTPSSYPNSHLVEEPLATPISRRDFGRWAGIAAAITLSSSSLLGCYTASIHESKPGDQTPDKAGGGLTADQAQEVEARLANVIRKYGNRLSEEQRQHLRRILTYNERMLVSIRTFPLQNGDPPASVLKISLIRQADPAKPASVAAEGSLGGGASANEKQV
jgi:hypothetical protein